MAQACTPISDYRRTRFSAKIAAGKTIQHDVYSRGEGSPVVLVQELPGIGQETLRLADRLVDAGFEVVMPHLFGPIGRTGMLGNLLRVFCMRREFALFSANKASPIVDWLKALCAEVREARGAPGVGVIGMCLTGNFALSLIADDSVLASVAAQPAMPVQKQAALHMSDAEIAASREALDHKKPMLGFRFEDDKVCTAEKFDCINEAFNGDGRERVRLKTLPGDAHSVLTIDFVDEEGHPTQRALQEVLDYFTAALNPAQ